MKDSPYRFPRNGDGSTEAVSRRKLTLDWQRLLRLWDANPRLPKRPGAIQKEMTRSSTETASKEVNEEAEHRIKETMSLQPGNSKVSDYDGHLGDQQGFVLDRIWKIPEL